MSSRIFRRQRRRSTRKRVRKTATHGRSRLFVHNGKTAYFRLSSNIRGPKNHQTKHQDFFLSSYSRQLLYIYIICYYIIRGNETSFASSLRLYFLFLADVLWIQPICRLFSNARQQRDSFPGNCAGWCGEGRAILLHRVLSRFVYVFGRLPKIFSLFSFDYTFLIFLTWGAADLIHNGKTYLWVSR